MSSERPPPRTPSSDNPQAERVRSFLELADAAAIAHHSFRLMVDDACLEPEFRDIPFSDGNSKAVISNGKGSGRKEKAGGTLAAVISRVGGFVNDRKRVLDAVFLDDPKIVVQSCFLVLQDAYHQRGIHSPEMMQRAQLFSQSFIDLRGGRRWPGVKLLGDGWDGWRESYAIDGQLLAGYAEHRNAILSPLNIHEIDIIGRKRCFTLHPEKWPKNYTTDDLVRMADTAHRVLLGPATAAAPSPAASTAATPQNDPPPTPTLYDALSVACVALGLVGNQCGLVKAIVAAGKPIPISDLLLKLKVGGSADSGWGNTVNPLNKKLKKHGLRIRRANSQATLVKFGGG